MITFYSTAEDPASQEVQEALRDLCLAHEVVTVPTAGPRPASLPAGTRPPALVDEGKVYQGREAILPHLEELRTVKELWYKYGSDACYCNAEGTVE